MVDSRVQGSTAEQRFRDAIEVTSVWLDALKSPKWRQRGFDVLLDPKRPDLHRVLMRPGHGWWTASIGATVVKDRDPWRAFSRLRRLVPARSPSCSRSPRGLWRATLR